MNTHQRITAFIRAITSNPVTENEKAQGLCNHDSAHDIIVEIFTTGNCGNFAVAMSIAFPEAKIFGVRPIDDFEKRMSDDYYGHTLVEIDGWLYDITGNVTDKFRKIKELTAAEIIKGDADMHYGNYSFDGRGPMI